MTGFATAEVSVGKRQLTWEIRSVNHRYLDLGFRLPEDFRALENQLRQHIGNAVKRGKVDCTLKLTSSAEAAGRTTIDTAQLAQLRELEQRVRERWPEAAGLTVNEILRWPGILSEEVEAREDLLAPALAAFADAVHALCAARAREGERLVELLLERIEAIEVLLRNVDSLLIESAPRHRDKLLERIARLDVEANPERLEQELAMIAQRADVAEEADRLRSHLSELKDVIAQDEPIGRRLDFLIQELNREANTLGSKVQDDVLAQRAVDLKVLIEQMREQVQNIE